MATIRFAAPQLLVDDLERALGFYEGRLGFARDFVYEKFYASVSRDGATLHLKCAPKTEADRAHRAAGQHLDAYLEVDDAHALHDELARRGATITQPVTEQAWRNLDFQVTDPDGYILCFSQPLDTTTQEEDA
jgi:uncharacterized glyoxalase superfamily protein PhnB